MLNFEKKDVITQEWVIQFMGKEIPMSAVKSFVQMLLIMIFIMWYGSLNQQLAHSNIMFWQYFAHEKPKCYLQQNGTTINIICPEDNSLKLTPDTNPFK